MLCLKLTGNLLSFKCCFVVAASDISGTSLVALHRNHDILIIVSLSYCSIDQAKIGISKQGNSHRWRVFAEYHNNDYESDEKLFLKFQVTSMQDSKPQHISRRSSAIPRVVSKPHVIQVFSI